MVINRTSLQTGRKQRVGNFQHKEIIAFNLKSTNHFMWSVKYIYFYDSQVHEVLHPQNLFSRRTHAHDPQYPDPNQSSFQSHDWIIL